MTCAAVGQGEPPTTEVSATCRALTCGSVSLCCAGGVTQRPSHGTAPCPLLALALGHCGLIPCCGAGGKAMCTGLSVPGQSCVSLLCTSGSVAAAVGGQCLHVCSAYAHLTNQAHVPMLQVGCSASIPCSPDWVLLCRWSHVLQEFWPAPRAASPGEQCAWRAAPRGCRAESCGACGHAAAVSSPSSSPCQLFSLPQASGFSCSCLGYFCRL